MTVSRYAKSRFWAVYDAEGRLVCVCVYLKGAHEVVARLTRYGQVPARPEAEGWKRMKKPEPATPDAATPEPAHPDAVGPPALLRIVGLDTLLLVRGEEDTYLNDKLGYCDFRHSRIVLSQGNSPTGMRETAVHEVLHAVDHAVQSDLSEQDVHRLSRALYAVLRDNPEFTRWLLL